jgi:8-oxo-dGTP diphosphatase
VRGAWGVICFLTSFAIYANDCTQDLRTLSQSYAKPGQPLGLAVIVILVRDGKVLMGERKSGYWGFGGGKYEACDHSIEQCASREIREEMGVEIKNLKLKKLQHIFIEEQGKQFVSAIITAETDQEPRAVDPDKNKNWTWFSWSKLPTPLFAPNIALVEEGFRPF